MGFSLTSTAKAIKKVFNWLKKHVRAVGFTGSIRERRALMDIAAKREEAIPVFAEMGSVNPVVVTQQGLNSKSDYFPSFIERNNEG
ncbi:MAG TPA: hypothetical protein EYG86_04100 [Crocinitomicaceae bacterium]|nr:hypothetical protein [Crocinitomicaceae bacterium]